jgi:hypothetical protein
VVLFVLYGEHCNAVRTDIRSEDERRYLSREDFGDRPRPGEHSPNSDTDADYLAGVSRGTLKRWLTGYGYWAPDGQRVVQPPLTPGT